MHYRRCFLRARLNAMENKEEYKVNLLQALHFHRRSWDAVKPETLSRCFRKAGFVMNEQEVKEGPDEPEEDVEELIEMFDKLVAADETVGDLLDFLDADNNLATNQPMNLEEIAEANSQVEETEMEETDAEEVVDKQRPVTALDALNGFKVFQKYMESHDVDPAMLRMCDKMDDFLTKERLQNMKQNKITNFFRPTYVSQHP